jgi:Zn finger protein HypA/HybF involved in hydrogenase expression
MDVNCRGYADARDDGGRKPVGDNFRGSQETNDEVLCFAFDAIAKGTSCEGIKLEIEHKPMQGQCKNCNERFDFKLNCPKCPKCDSEEFDLLPDAPLLLEQIEFEME